MLGCFFFLSHRSLRNNATDLRNVKVCGKLLKQVVRVRLGAESNENLKIGGFVVERNKHFLLECLWHVSVEWLGYSNASLAGN